MGHGGDCCEKSRMEERRINFVHEYGITKIKVGWCGCQPLQQSLQLVRAGLWPATWAVPRTMFSINVMRNCQLLSLQSQATTYDYFKYLARLTDPIEPQDVTVSCH